MKFNVLKLAFTLTFLSVLIASCVKTDPNEETNDMLNGKWEATSFITADNIERLTGVVTENELVFQKDSIDGGLLSWDVVTPLIQLTDWSGRYTISNSGTRLNFYDKTFVISFDNDLLKLESLDAENGFDIVAKMK